ncbi:MAG: aspartate-semialdehyde dehydrogenase [Gemmatimonadetes bacterium]|nr:aspartate-semialdehyde dehydrogenase [Gemmatimonadota bacterium]
MEDRYEVALVGATGAVGEVMLELLAERDFPVGGLKLLSSPRSAGREIDFRGEKLVVQDLAETSFDGVDLVLSSAGGSISREFAPRAVAAGAVVVDNTSAFRMDDEVPLVVPEINPGDLERHSGVIANPNCSTIILDVAIWPLHRANRIRRAVVSTYQAISGAGAKAMAELEEQTREVLAGNPASPRELPHQIAFNLFSHDSAIGAQGYCEEEEKMVRETRKIFHDDAIGIAPTCVRVPVMRAHSEAVNIEFEEPMSPERAREILAAAPGVEIVDDPDGNHFPMPVEASGRDEVLVGRIRRDISRGDGRGIELFVSGDQLRKGAALNAIQIAEALIAKGLLRPAVAF